MLTTVPIRTLCTLAFLLGPAAAGAQPPPWQRTESRADCADFDPLRRPFFGDTHVHTKYSFDAATGDVRTGPRDAYEFALGAPIALPPYDGLGMATRTTQLRRPLDFAVVTDHAEFLGEVQVCLTPTLPGYDSDECVLYRAGIPQLAQESTPGIVLFGASYLTGPSPSRFSFCGPDLSSCSGPASLVWQDTQDAAEQYYDRSSACTLTTFVGYEYTGNPGVQNLHRNVIFRNEVATPLPVTYMEQPTAEGLLAELRSECLDSLDRCDVLAIPHNSNFSNGMMFLPQNADGSAFDAADAAFRAAMEPVVEVFQAKGDSECRQDVLNNDELCSFEKWDAVRIGLPTPPGTVYPPLSFVRGGLKQGLLEEERVGVNPFRFGLIGSTDTHNSTPGAVREDDYVSAGHLGTRDATPELMVAGLGIGVIGGIYANPGGLAVLWAEENSRDALFEAMRRREVYGTSGTRPIVRFFGGRLTGIDCASPDLIERAYASGVPMGGELGPVRRGRSPRFAVLAFKDPGTPGAPGTALQRIQIVKGWVDRSGDAQEKVFEVAGDPDSGASVDTASCEPQGTGFDELCAVWQDPEFDADERAFYYARVVENPVCRWSTRLCNAQGIDCSAPGSVPPAFANCCNPRFPKTVQERAWTSPIFYRPESIGHLRAQLRFGSSVGGDRLAATVPIGRLPEGFDLTATELRVTLSDDDEIYSVAIPGSAWSRTGPHRFVLNGALGGLRRATFRSLVGGGAVLRFDTQPLDLAAADRGDHMVELELVAGAWSTAHVRRWLDDGRSLAAERR